MKRNCENSQVVDEDSKEKTTTDGVVVLRFDAPRTTKSLWVKKI